MKAKGRGRDKDLFVLNMAKKHVHAWDIFKFIYLPKRL